MHDKEALENLGLTENSHLAKHADMLIYRENVLDRPIKTAKEAEVVASFAEPCVLMETSEFLKWFQDRWGYKITRRTLQLYSSPQFRILPPPVHKGKRKSYYTNPEHTRRLAVIMTLREKYFFPLVSIANVLRHFPEEYYRLILDEDILTGQEIIDFASYIRVGFKLEDILFEKVAKILEAKENGLYWKAEEKVGKDSPEDAERLVNKWILKDIESLGKWLKTDRRLKMGRLDIPQERLKTTRVREESMKKKEKLMWRDLSNM